MNSELHTVTVSLINAPTTLHRRLTYNLGHTIMMALAHSLVMMSTLGSKAQVLTPPMGWNRYSVCTPSIPAARPIACLVPRRHGLLSRTAG